MSRFAEQCQGDIAWRISEIALLKKSTAMPSVSEEMRKILLKYSVPALYAIWEGFVTSIFSEYVKVINTENVSMQAIDPKIKTYHSFCELNLASPPSDFSRKEALVKKMQEHFASNVKLSTDIATNSNVDYASLSAIMQRYGVAPLPEDQYKGRLSKFLNFRNKIAHGNNSIIMDDSKLNEFSVLISELMDEVFITLNDCVENKRYIVQP